MVKINKRNIYLFAQMNAESSDTCKTKSSYLHSPQSGVDVSHTYYSLLSELLHCVSYIK
jgi:hypothetical protein